MTEYACRQTVDRTINNVKDVGGQIMYDLAKCLECYGYQIKENDDYLLMVALEKVRETVKNETNQSVIPKELHHVILNMTLGEFLLMKKTFAPDSLTSLDLDFAVKQIQTGDTNTVFAVGKECATPEQRLDTFINYLLNHGKTEFSAFRRFKW